MRTTMRSLLMLGAALVALPAYADIHYAATTRSEGQGKRAKATVMSVDGWVAGEKARVTFASSDNPLLAEGSYLLTRDGGKTVLLVNPAKKTYARWDLSAMMGTLGAVMQGMGGMFKMDFSEPKVEQLGSEPGGQILGMPTTHYRYRTSYTLEMKVMGMHRAMHTTSDQDLWTTTAVEAPALGVWLRKDALVTGIDGLDQLIRSEMSKLKGFPLKTITLSTTDNGKGKTSTTQQTMEVKTFDRSAPAPPGGYQIPAGFEEVELVPNLDSGRK